MNDHIKKSEATEVVSKRHAQDSVPMDEHEVQQEARIAQLEQRVALLETRLQDALKAPLVMMERLGMSLVNQARGDAQKAVQTTWEIRQVPEQEEATEDTLRIVFNGSADPLAYTVPDNPEDAGQTFPLDAAMIAALHAFRQEVQMSPHSVAMVNLYAVQ